MKSALATAIVLVLLIAGARFLSPDSPGGRSAPDAGPPPSIARGSPPEKPGAGGGSAVEPLAGNAGAPLSAKENTLTVTVVDDAGRPVKDATVDVLDPFVLAVPPGSKRVARGTTDENGRFESSAARRGGFYVHVRSRDRAGIRRTDEGRELRVTVRRGHEITGWLVGAAGEPVAEGRVSVHRERGFGSLAFRSRTDGAGRFRLGPLPSDWLDGDLFIHATGPGRVPVARSLTRQEREGGEIELVLPAAVSVRLTVRDERGEVVPDATVTPRYAGETVRRSWPAPDERGRVELGGLPAGRWSLFVSSPRHATTRIDPVPGTGTLDLGAVRLSRGGEVSGRVEDESGRPVVGVELHVLSDALGVEVSRGQSDGEGDFRLGRIGPGSHELIALTEGAVGSVEGVRPGDSGVVVRLRDLPGVRVELEEENGEPAFANELVLILLRGGEERKRLVRRGRDSFSEAVFRDLPPGVWDLEVHVDGASATRRSAFRIPDEGLARLRVVQP